MKREGDDMSTEQRQHGLFNYKTVVTIGDTNILGNMYSSNHFKLQGATRELWLSKCVNQAEQHLSEGLMLITKSAHCDYLKDYYLHDEIVYKMPNDFYQAALACCCHQYSGQGFKWC